jgi:hypothetical protein
MVDLDGDGEIKAHVDNIEVSLIRSMVKECICQTAVHSMRISLSVLWFGSCWLMSAVASNYDAAT